MGVGGINFYAGDGRIVGVGGAEWLQESFESLVALFDMFGLKTNGTTTKSMACTLGFQ